MPSSGLKMHFKHAETENKGFSSTRLKQLADTLDPSDALSIAQGSSPASAWEFQVRGLRGPAGKMSGYGVAGSSTDMAVVGDTDAMLGTYMAVVGGHRCYAGDIQGSGGRHRCYAGDRLTAQ